MEEVFLLHGLVLLLQGIVILLYIPLNKTQILIRSRQT